MYDTPNTAKILIVDDSEVGRNLLVSQATFLGMASVAVESGALALEKLQSEEFDLILMDIFMPGLDGIETTAQIREYERNHNLIHTPIIASTGGAEKQDCLNAGLDDYLRKPIMLEDLRRILTRWLPARLPGVEKQANRKSM